MTKHIWIILLLLICNPAFGEDFSSKVREPVKQSIEIRQQTQKAEDEWHVEKQKLTAQYDALLHDNEKLLSTNRELTARTRDANQRIQHLAQEIKGVEAITTGLDPFLTDMFGRILGLFESNPHFLNQERMQRITRLERILKDQAVTDSEKYRKLMEAALIEAEYGNTIDVYQEKILLDQKEMMADIFRLGRISLFCQSPDQKVTGYFNVSTSKWEKLPKKYNQAIHTAIDIGSKRRPADIVTLPLGRMAVK